MKPIKPKYSNMTKIELEISDVSKEVLNQYAKYTKYSISEILDRLLGGIDYPIPRNEPFESILSTKDEGIRLIRSLTDTRTLSTNDLAHILIYVGNWAVNNFYQELHRRVSILERPLKTACGDGRSYIYANYNPSTLNKC